MPFEQNSYLGKQIENIRNENLILNKDILIDANKLNQLMNKTLYSLKHTDDINRDFFVIGLICKIITSYNSVIILLNYGLSSDAKSILRSMMESAFHMRAIIFSSDYFLDYLKKADKEKLSLMRNISKNPQFFNAEIINAISKEQIEEIEIEIKSMNKVNTFELAKLARMEDMYLYNYNILSLNTHGNAKSIVDNFIFKSDNNAVFNMIPNYEDFNYVLLTALLIIKAVVEGIDQYFDENYKDLSETIESIIKPHFKK